MSAVSPNDMVKLVAAFLVGLALVQSVVPRQVGRDAHDHPDLRRLMPVHDLFVRLQTPETRRIAAHDRVRNRLSGCGVILVRRGQVLA